MRHLILMTVALAMSLTTFGCDDDSTDGADTTPPADTTPADTTPGETTGNTDPVASFTMSPACTSSSSDEITFTSTSTDADSDALTCSWTFASGNPSSATGCTVTGVKFPNAAPYTCKLTVSDGNGGTAEATQSIAPCP